MSEQGCMSKSNALVMLVMLAATMVAVIAGMWELAK